MWLQVVSVAAPCCVGVVCLGAGAVGVLRAFHGSVGLCPPTVMQLQEERAENCALFRHLPQLREKFAWRELGDYPTPVHDLKVAAGGRTVTVSVKREDYASPTYGGNKVRTLQHQLAVCEARLSAGGPQKLVVLGSGGSNQVVATIVHARAVKALPPVEVAWVSPDAPDLDNTLNMLSTFSFKTGGVGLWDDWRTFAQAAWAAFSGGAVVLPLGGNSPSGVLGQVGGALELAEQISKGEADDPDGIYVAVGSSCTVSGLIVGVALARHLGLRAFQSPKFKIHGVLVHPLFAAAQRTCGLHTAPWASFVPLTVSHTVRNACAELSALGGPNVLPLALEIMASQLRLETEADFVGDYGTHSRRSKDAAGAYEKTGQLSFRNAPATADGPKPLWLCGHFAAKSFAALLRDAGDEPDLKLLFWHTKSATQPRGPEDEWQRMREACESSPAVRAWADEGVATSPMRPGGFESRGNAQQYRPLMTPVK
ncbi:hypothetical protein M885DRAFT_587109 [Pelagophyceae sp. CCMP2097]|nr:hypothetical protein M885DRAFT_587109 [Pelagophyceae sp. CCMP2097]